MLSVECSMSNGLRSAPTHSTFNIQHSTFNILPAALQRAKMQEIRAAFYGLTRLHENLVHDSVRRRGNLVLHLHRFEHEQARSAADFRAFFDQHTRDAARHERFDDAAI